LCCHLENTNTKRVHLDDNISTHGLIDSLDAQREDVDAITN